MNRYLSLAAALVLVATGAGARDCRTLVKSGAYQRAAGPLASAVPLDLMRLPHDFLCNGKCGGATMISATVHTDGAISDLEVDSNGWTDRPDWHATIVKQRLTKVRFQPPRLKGKPVCVRYTWMISFRPTDAQVLE